MGERRQKKSPDFPLIVVLLEEQKAPGLQFLRRMHWIITRRSNVRNRCGSHFRRCSRRQLQPTANCGAIPPPIAVSKRWRRRTAIISSGEGGKRSRCSMLLRLRTGCRCSSAIRGSANPRSRGPVYWRHSSARHGPRRWARRMYGRRSFRTAANGAFSRSSPAPIRSRRWWSRSSIPGSTMRLIRSG